MTWSFCFVVGSGPSMTAELGERCRGHHVIAVNDAWKLVPFADVLYACDAQWWDCKDHAGFAGEKWTSISNDDNPENADCATRHGLKLIRGKYDDDAGFSFTPGLIHFGHISGFQAVNLALLRGAKRIILLGFDMRMVGGKAHFFGAHPWGLKDIDESVFSMGIHAFDIAAKRLPKDVTIINATPGSALQCFPIMSFDDAYDRLHRHRTESLAATD
jgi:hypothetical protein